jgi:hypothetical protein
MPKPAAAEQLFGWDVKKWKLLFARGGHAVLGDRCRSRADRYDRDLTDIFEVQDA